MVLIPRTDFFWQAFRAHALTFAITGCRTITADSGAFWGYVTSDWSSAGSDPMILLPVLELTITGISVD